MTQYAESDRRVVVCTVMEHWHGNQWVYTQCTYRRWGGGADSDGDGLGNRVRSKVFY